MEAGTTASFPKVPENTRIKLSFCTNGSMRVLNTNAASGAVGSTVRVVSSPSLVTVRCKIDGEGQHMTTASSNSVTPTPVFPEQQTIGTRLPSATARTISLESSSSVGGFPSKYLSITSSSTSMMDSISGSLILVGSTNAPAVSSGTWSVLMTPLKSVP